MTARRRAASVRVEEQPGCRRDRAGDLGPRRAVGPALQPTLAELSRPGRGSDKVPHPPADALDGIPAEHRRARAARRCPS